MGFEEDFAGMLPDSLIFDTATRDDTGKLTADGNPQTVPCYIEGETVIVQSGGKEVVSKVQVFVDVYNLTMDGHLYTLPSRYDPNVDREAVFVDHVSDDRGQYYEMVMF
jgi:hypothetical protein